MAEIDRMMSKPGSPPPPAAAKGAAPTRPSTVPGATLETRRHHLAGAWFLVLLALGLAVAIPFWPYGHSCGLGLGGYLAAVAALLIVSVSATSWTWRHRRGVGHGFALLALLASLVYTAAEVLPRIGYARTEASWICTGRPAPAPAPRSAPAPAPSSPSPSSPNS
jgi:hypothetical protein